MTNQGVEYTKILEKVGTVSGWGAWAQIFLDLKRMNTPYDPDWEERHAISRRVFEDATLTCIDAFKSVTGMDHDEYLACQNSPQSNMVDPATYYDWFRLVDGRGIQEVENVLKVAKRTLNPAYLYAVMAVNFFRAEKKMTFDELGATPYFQGINAQSSYSRAKKLLISALKEQGITDSPYLKTREQKPDIKQMRVRIPRQKTLDLSDPKTAMIYRISRTLFDAKDHGIICSELFQPPEVVRDREKLAEKFGVASGKDYRQRVYPRLLNKLKAAIEREDPKLDLPEHLEVLRSGLLYANHSLSFSRMAYDCIDEAKIDLNVPGTREILEALYALEPRLEVPVFIMTRLYRTEEKMTSAEVKEALPHATAEKPHGLITKIKGKLKELGYEHYCDHPVLRQFARTRASDLPIRDKIKSDQFAQEYAQLNTAQKRVVDLASLCFNPRQFYCFFKAFYTSPNLTYEQIAQEVGTKEIGHTHQLAHKADGILKTYMNGLKEQNIPYLSAA